MTLRLYSPPSSYAGVAAATIGLILIYIIILAIHRLFFHRVAHIPGPKLAALTYLYQFYYDGFPHHGQWLFHCEKLHQKYGPIVRVGPDEIHIRDPTFYNEAFGKITSRRNKSPLWFWFANEPKYVGCTAFATIDHNLHATRRAAMSGFFSKAKVRELEHRIRVHVDKACQRLAGVRDSGDIMDLIPLTTALTLDVISEYSFGLTAGLLAQPNMGADVRKMLDDGPRVQPIGRQFPSVMIAMINILYFMRKFRQAANSYTDFTYMITSAIEEPYRRAFQAEKQGKVANQESSKSIIEALASHSALPEHERSFDRIQGEAVALIGAGTDTTSRTLAVGLFHMFGTPAILDRLLAEIRTLMPTSTSPLPSVDALSQLPFLTACIHESLRMAHGVAGRLVRTTPDQDLQYGGYTIPRGASFSMSQYMQHTDPSVFPEPFSFQPDRYLGDPKTVRETLRYLVPFGKGPRMCLGINLAWAELYLSYAAVISKFDLNFTGTTEYDVTPASEFFVACMPEDSKGIRCRIYDQTR